MNCWRDFMCNSIVSKHELGDTHVWSRREWLAVTNSSYICSGLHYFYGMSTTLDCKDWQGVFGLYNNGSLIGLGLPTHGYQTDGDDITWFEKPSSFALQVCSRKLSSFGQIWFNICSLKRVYNQYTTFLATQLVLHLNPIASVQLWIYLWLIESLYAHMEPFLK